LDFHIQNNVKQLPQCASTTGLNYLHTLKSPV